MPANIAIFASGSGSNAQNIIEYFKDHSDIHVSVLMSNKKDALALERARKLGVPTDTFDREQFYNSDEVLNKLKVLQVDWIVLAGFLWLMPANLVKAFPNTIINIHPALLPKFGGKGMYGMHVHNAVFEAGEPESGISIHYVNENYDEGTLIFQAKCLVENGDTPETIAKKVQALEHEHFPKVVEELIKNCKKNI
ncbi:MAG: phosphoribosylglycinamide formyltransferase [Cytophagaceae bacterium]